MKNIDKMSRLAGMLEKWFRLLNEHFFNSSLETPIITVIPTPRAYAHYTLSKVWDSSKGEGKHEINVGAGTLDRPVECIVASLIHEMVHMNNDTVLNVQDTSNNGMYHNRVFKHEAEAHGLIVSRSDKYGWSHTEPSDELLEFVIDNLDVFKDIEINRGTFGAAPIGGGHYNNGGAIPPTATAKTHHRKYICPCCGNSVRATRAVNIACLNCGVRMVEV